MRSERRRFNVLKVMFDKYGMIDADGWSQELRGSNQNGGGETVGFK